VTNEPADTPNRSAGAPSDNLFRDPDLAWQPVSLRLAVERRLPVAVVALLGLAALVGGLLASSPWDVVLLVLGGVVLLGAAIAWVVVKRAVQTWQYAEREQDLLVSHGRLYRQLTVIPYGRMQVIEVSANPVSTRLDIATVTLVTASASTDARIPGLPTSEAHALRDRLAAKGEAMTAGL
jgi:membrane protein YdbS with pleckstrin-like domain